jgi:hypothetical protein
MSNPDQFAPHHAPHGDPTNKTDVHTVPGGHVDPFAAPAELVQILLRLS